MRRRLRTHCSALIFAAGLWAWNSAVAQPAPDEGAVAATLAAFHAALASSDPQKALGLLAEDALIVEAGAVETLAAYRQHHLQEDIAFAAAVPAQRRAPHIFVEGDVAWAVSTSESSGTFKGRAIDALGAELAVLARTREGWRIRAIHWSSRRRSPP